MVYDDDEDLLISCNESFRNIPQLETLHVYAKCGPLYTVYSPVKKINVSHESLTIPYSGKLSREKTFANWRKRRFSRKKLSRIARWCRRQNTPCLPISRRKLSQIATKPRNSQMFSSSKVSLYTVCKSSPLSFSWPLHKWKESFLCCQIEIELVNIFMYTSLL